MTNLTNLLTATRDDLRTRRERRAADRRLAQELGAYTSATDRAELDAILARHDESVVAPLEDIINRRRSAA